MSILEKQNITTMGLASMQAMSTKGMARMMGALGDGYSPDLTKGWSGYSYRPPGLTTLVGSTKGLRSRVSPDAAVDTTDPAIFGHQYGPEQFASMSNSNTTVLGELADMIGSENTPEWSEQNPGPQSMKLTFTSGDQMRSLWNTEVGVNGVPVASGGQFRGYQADNKYEINNWNAAGTDVTSTVNGLPLTAEDAAKIAAAVQEFQDSGGLEGLGDQAAADAEAAGSSKTTTGQETTRGVADISKTGIRNLPGMMGPRS